MATTLGEMFRSERKKRNLTTFDVSRDTRIMQSSIQALEDNDYAHLPAPGYVRGYIVSYCRYLRVDSIPFLQQYEEDTGNVRQTRIEDLTVNHTAVEKLSDQHDIPWRTAIIVALVLLVIAVGVFLAIFLRSKGTSDNPAATPPPVQETTTTPSTGTTGTAAATSQGGGAAAGTTAQPAGKPFSFTVEAKPGAASQLTVITDGNQAYSGVFTSGMKKTFQVQGTATLTIENPAALTVTRDGKAVAVPDKVPATLSLTAAAQ